MTRKSLTREYRDKHGVMHRAPGTGMRPPIPKLLTLELQLVLSIPGSCVLDRRWMDIMVGSQKQYGWPIAITHHMYKQQVSPVIQGVSKGDSVETEGS